MKFDEEVGISKEEQLTNARLLEEAINKWLDQFKKVGT